jgi:hypothetical protein
MHVAAKAECRYSNAEKAANCPERPHEEGEPPRAEAVLPSRQAPVLVWQSWHMTMMQH